jgi:hypothetical protein
MNADNADLDFSVLIRFIRFIRGKIFFSFKHENLTNRGSD